MIVKDQRTAHYFAASAVALCMLFSSPRTARAADLTPAATTGAPAAPVAQDADNLLAAPPLSVSLVLDGRAEALTTRVASVGALLAERGLHPSPNDFVSPEPATPLTEGATVVVRSAVPIRIEVGNERRLVESPAASVAELLAAQHIELRPSDEVVPERSAPLLPQTVVRIVRIDTWTAHSHAKIVPAVKQRTDAKLLRGKSRTIDAGSAGVREVTLRFVKRGDGSPTRIVLASRIVRAPRARVVARGIATYDSLARVAQQGFASAIQFASSALHMLATAYTAGCYGCSGITASGARAGFGIIAVDPSVIPLGTRLFIPGYGRAVAGDTGGAILGSRVDLGFNSDGEALRWGKRPVTVYILK